LTLSTHREPDRRRSPLVRVVLDTNVLIGDAYNKESASARIVESCLEGRLTPLVSEALRAEYERMLPRAVRGPFWRSRFEQLLSGSEVAEFEVIAAVVEEDPSDDILFATAISGRAHAIITNDRLVLRVGNYQGIRVVRPRQFITQWDESMWPAPAAPGDESPPHAVPRSSS
jgi:putative PIN family toxin of toxin-antitoxin system